MNKIINEVATSLNITSQQVETVLDLLANNNTIPFIARYRQEATKGLDENQIFEINKVYEYQVNLSKRKEDVIRLIDEKGMLNENLKKLINEATKIVEVDNIYQPYKDKKKTKASIAIELGLEPLAHAILRSPNLNLETEAKKYYKEDLQDLQQVIEYAQDIIAQYCVEHIRVREFSEKRIASSAIVKGVEKKKHDDTTKVFEMYYDFNEKLATMANHRVLGLNRAVSKKVVTMTFEVNHEYMVENIYKYFCSKSTFINKDIIMNAMRDGYKRLLFPSITRQLWSNKVEVASNDAIALFALNLEKLLLTPPLKNKVILGFDPAFRTGCKLAVIDKDGTLLEIGLCFPFENEGRLNQAKQTIIDLINKYQVQIIAIG
ncbi:MAG: Tex-like N-terminal domain-containing protein, partial [Bacilli bacterium]